MKSKVSPGTGNRFRLCLCLCLCLLPLRRHGVKCTDLSQNYSQFRRLAFRILHHAKHGGVRCPEFKGWVAAIAREKKLDPWGRPVVGECVGEPRVRSAGPDGLMRSEAIFVLGEFDALSPVP